MKIRKGFVSNSSSTSFCIYGANIEIDDLKQFLPENTNFNKEDWEFGIDWWNINSIIIKQLGKEFSFFFEGEELQNFYIGRTLESLEDNETGKQFKKLVEEKIKKFFGEDYECKIIEEIIQQ